MANDIFNLAADTLWKRVLTHLIEELSELTVMNHFGMESRGISLENQVLTVELPEDKDGKLLLMKFSFFIENALKAADAPDGIELRFVNPQPVAPTLAADNSVANNAKSGAETVLPEMTFDSFVEGPSNQFPVTMARYVATKPGDDVNRTNPLFLYGPTGVGKTHLMHAIGNLAKKINSSLSILYTTSENLLNEYVRSWTSDANKETFRQKFRSVDILLVDDIQFMAGKKGLQDEFFNIFNALKDNHHQIVMTSDRAPKEIPELMDRLVSRFESGICADVDMPAYETRLNILMMKLRSIPGVTLSHSALDFIAQKVTSSVRALEGALSWTVNYARMFPTNMASAVTVEVLEKSVLKNFIAQEDSIIKLTPTDIQKTVCEYYDITQSDLLGKSREQRVAIPRQVAIYLIRKLTDSSATETGKIFNRTHATILHACNAINDLMNQNDSKTILSLKAITSKLGRSISDLK
jgi:chromosomal replication initiator protein